LEKQWAEAGVKGDNSFFDRIAVDDYAIVDASGELRNKRQELAVSQNEKFQTSTVDDLSVRLYGDSAVVLGRYALTGTNMGHPYSETGRFTDVWVKRSGKWRLVSSQNTSLPAVVTPTLPTDQFFIEKEKEVWEALKHKDRAAVNRLLVDDFVGMYDFGFFNKSEWVKQIDEQYTVDDYTIMNPKVLHPSPTTALLLYTSTCKGTGAWADYCSNTSRISDLWVERNGQWLDLFSQDTTATIGELDDAVLKAIVANEQRIFETLKRNDIAAFGNMLPDDLIDVEDDGIHTKAEWLKEFEEQKKTGLLFRDFKMDDLRLVRYGPSAATLVFRETINGTQEGKPFEWHINSSSGYVNRSGEWVPVLYQDVAAK